MGFMEEWAEIAHMEKVLHSFDLELSFLSEPVNFRQLSKEVRTSIITSGDIPVSDQGLLRLQEER